MGAALSCLGAATAPPEGSGRRRAPRQHDHHPIPRKEALQGKQRDAALRELKACEDQGAPGRSSPALLRRRSSGLSTTGCGLSAAQHQLSTVSSSLLQLQASAGAQDLCPSGSSTHAGRVGDLHGAADAEPMRLPMRVGIASQQATPRFPSNPSHQAPAQQPDSTGTWGSSVVPLVLTTQASLVGSDSLVASVASSSFGALAVPQAPLPARSAGEQPDGSGNNSSGTHACAAAVIDGRSAAQALAARVCDIEGMAQPGPACKGRGSGGFAADSDPEVASILDLVVRCYGTAYALVAVFGDKRVLMKASDGALHCDSLKRWPLCECTDDAPERCFSGRGTSGLSGLSGDSGSNSTDTAGRDGSAAQMLVLPDVETDPRLASQAPPLPNGRQLRFFASMPLIDPQQRLLGTLCLADSKPWPAALDASQSAILGNFAGMMARHLGKARALRQAQRQQGELESKLHAIQKAHKHLHRALDCYDQSMLLVDTGEEGFSVQYANEAWEQLTGLPRHKVMGSTLRALLGVVRPGHEHSKLPDASHVRAAAQGKPFQFSDVCIRGAVEGRTYAVKMRPAYGNQLQPSPLMSAPNRLPPAMPSTSPPASLLSTWQPGTSLPTPATSKLFFLTVEPQCPSDPLSLPPDDSGLLDSRALLRLRQSKQAGGVIDGLELGAVLGQGSLGTVYTGKWFGSPVAVKMIEQSDGADTGLDLESLLVQEMLPGRHPHIVCTLHYCVHRGEGLPVALLTPRSSMSRTSATAVAAAVASARGTAPLTGSAVPLGRLSTPLRRTPLQRGSFCLVQHGIRRQQQEQQQQQQQGQQQQAPLVQRRSQGLGTARDGGASGPAAAAPDEDRPSPESHLLPRPDPASFSEFARRSMERVSPSERVSPLYHAASAAPPLKRMHRASARASFEWEGVGQPATAAAAVPPGAAVQQPAVTVHPVIHVHTHVATSRMRPSSVDPAKAASVSTISGQPQQLPAPPVASRMQRASFECERPAAAHAAAAAALVRSRSGKTSFGCRQPDEQHHHQQQLRQGALLVASASDDDPHPGSNAVAPGGRGTSGWAVINFSNCSEQDGGCLQEEEDEGTSAASGSAQGPPTSRGGAAPGPQQWLPSAGRRLVSATVHQQAPNSPNWLSGSMALQPEPSHPALAGHPMLLGLSEEGPSSSAAALQSVGLPGASPLGGQSGLSGLSSERHAMGPPKSLSGGANAVPKSMSGGFAAAASKTLSSGPPSGMGTGAAQSVLGSAPEGNAAAGQDAPLRSPAQVWIVMEFCDKGCLQDAIDRGWLHDRSGLAVAAAAPPGSGGAHMMGRPRMAAVLATATEVASALTYLHARGVVHGTLTPRSVMLSSSGSSATAGGRGFVPKLADFGLARAAGTHARAYVGLAEHSADAEAAEARAWRDLGHQPPETLLASGGGGGGYRSMEGDVYCFGVIMWQMYTGLRPYDGLSREEVLAAVCSHGPGARLRFPDGAPEGYMQLAKQCMAAEPEDRPTADVVCARLEAMLPPTSRG